MSANKNIRNEWHETSYEWGEELMELWSPHFTVCMKWWNVCALTRNNIERTFSRDLQYMRNHYEMAYGSYEINEGISNECIKINL